MGVTFNNDATTKVGQQIPVTTGPIVTENGRVVVGPTADVDDQDAD